METRTSQPDNRAHRRFSENSVPPHLRKLNLAIERRNQAVGARNGAGRQIVRNGGNYSSFLYSPGDPFLEYAATLPLFSQAYRSALGTGRTPLEKQFIAGERAYQWHFFG